MHENQESPAAPTEESSPVGARHSRRAFLRGAGIAAGAAVVAPALGQAPAEAGTPGLEELGSAATEFNIKLNGRVVGVSVQPRTTLLEALREQLDLVGTKQVCDRGSCGACTVLVEGESVCSCLMPAIDARGKHVLTIEGLANDPRFAGLIEAYCENDAAQCGYCIPGFVVRSAALLQENPAATAAEIKAGLSGNICRCGTYTKIFDAMAAALAKGGVK